LRSAVDGTRLNILLLFATPKQNKSEKKRKEKKRKEKEPDRWDGL
jgi:hypothetical protein